MSLSTRIVVFILVLTCLFGIANTIAFNHILSSTLPEQQKYWAETLTSSLAESLANSTLNEDISAAAQTLENIVASNKDIEYAYITNFDGRLFAASDLAAVKQLLATQQGLTDHTDTIPVHYGNKDINQYTFPLVQGMAASVHVGVNNDTYSMVIGQVQENLLWFFLVSLVLAVAFSLFFTRHITRPVAAIAGMMKRYAETGTLPEDELTSQSDSEIHGLELSFRNVATAQLESEQLREQVLEEIHESQARLETSQAITHVGSWDWNIETGELAWTDEIYRIFGLVPRQFGASYEAFLERVHPDDREHVINAVNDAVADANNNYDIHHRITRPSGEVRTVHEKGIVFRDDDNNPVRMIGAVHDITEQLAAQEALRQSEEQLRSVFNNAEVGIAMVSLQGHFVSVNPKLCDITGYREPELVQKTFQDITHPDDLETDLGQLQQLLDGKIDHYHMEKRYFRKDNAVVWIDLSVGLVRDEHGGPLYFISVIEDINHRKQAEAEIIRLNQDLENKVRERTLELEASRDEAVRANRAKDVFLSQMSHELRTPMNAILGFAQLLQLDNSEPLGGDQADSVRQIQVAGEHLMVLINQVLELSQISAGNYDMLPVDFDINDMLKDILDSVDTLLRDKSITVENRLAGEKLPYIMADVKGLHSVLLNIVSNAIKFNAMGGNIILDYEQAGDDYLRVTISDTGSGIKPEHYSRIFNAFDQASDGEFVNGAGIGLTISKKVIESMSGRIGFDSEVGKGSRFWIDVPLATETQD